tara:strand:+ start:3508 stop:4002 length:495 start_codon:yes stop_codon:yes gene_type:complete
MRINFFPVIALATMVAVIPRSALANGDDSLVIASGHLTTEQVVDRVFTSVERRILRRYYEARGGSAADDGTSPAGHGHKGKGKKHKGMPPGLAKRGGNLPPGLAKRGGVLPPGLAKRLPDDLARELPPRSPKYRRVVVDNDIVLIDAVTNKVLDVLEDVLLGRR